MLNFGFSTGCVFHQKLNVIKAINLFSNYNLKNIELSFANLWELDEFKLDTNTQNKLKLFDNISIHAPFIKIFYNNDLNTKKILDKLDDLCKIINISYVVFHPDVINDFTLFNNYNFNKSIENMDIRKNKGISIQEFQNFINLENINFVFDLQHAFEHDKLNENSQNILKIMESKLSHIHLSGSNKNSIHSLLVNSENKEKIIQFLIKNKLYNKPIILEGGISTNFNDDIIREINLINEFENLN